ncbi:unnamed protein product, partial [Prorocentrum cordatum]
EIRPPFEHNYEQDTYGLLNDGSADWCRLGTLYGDESGSRSGSPRGAGQAESDVEDT